MTADSVIYARFSSDKQTEDSIEAQRRACMAYASAKGLTVVGEYVDEAISGKGSKTASRTGYQRMLKACEQKKFGIILVHKYDRIARSLAEHVNLSARLQALGIELIAAAQDFGQTNEAQMLRAITWAMSEYYIDNLAGEVRKGLNENALKGMHNGGVAPFGYDVIDKKYVINEIEAAYVRKIFQCAADRVGFVGIVREMDECGIRGKRGKPIKYTQIYEMLRNEKYTGVYVYSQKEESNRADRRSKPNAVRIEGALPVIIERPLFEEVRQIMDSRKQTGISSRLTYLCSGLVYCQCGSKMHAQPSAKNGHQYSYYRCVGKCGAPSVKVEEVEARALQYLQNLLSSENQELIVAALKKYQSTEKINHAEHAKGIKQEVDRKNTIHLWATFRPAYCLLR